MDESKWIFMEKEDGVRQDIENENRNGSKWRKSVLERERRQVRH